MIFGLTPGQLNSPIGYQKAEDVMLLMFSLFLAMLLGFSAHRASICTVGAVVEVLSTHRAYMLLSFVKTILWVIAVTMLLYWWLPMTSVPSPGWELSTISVAGGFLFGIGAAVNKGCAFSTLTRLADGQVKMVLSLVGFCLGVLVYISLPMTSLVPPHVSVPTAYGLFEPWSFAIITSFGAWIVWEARRLWRTRQSGLAWRALILSDRYRLSTAAVLLGVSNGILYAIYGSWAYTSTLGKVVERFMGSVSGPSAHQVALFAFVLAGMALSTWQRGSFHLDWRPSFSWALNLMGGLLMGLGAAMVPGGNDVLVLQGIPGLSPHAVPVYAAMLAGIATVILMMRLVSGKAVSMDCSGDVCRTIM